MIIRSRVPIANYRINMPHNQEDLRRIYSQRFQANLDYRRQVWNTIIHFCFKKYIPQNSNVLDLGCGYGEFINQIQARNKFAMDLNPDSPFHLAKEVVFYQQDCSGPWPVERGTLDCVFTSNFFEHLPSKEALGKTLDEVSSALKPGGSLIAIGPNIKFLPGAYWDFWDHYLPLTELSLVEARRNRGFQIELCKDRFLPYTMAGKRPVPVQLIRLYLKIPIFWPILGKQFLIIAKK